MICLVHSFTEGFHDIIRTMQHTAYIVCVWHTITMERLGIGRAAALCAKHSMKIHLFFDGHKVIK